MGNWDSLPPPQEFCWEVCQFSECPLSEVHVCLCRKMLFCTLTNRYVSMEPVEVRGHIDGKRYKKALEECKSRLQEAVLSAPFESPPARLGI